MNPVALKLEEAAKEGVQCKRFFWKFRKIDRKTTVTEALFNNVAGLRPAEKTPTQVFSSQLCEIFEKTFFTEHFGVTAFE